MVPEGLATGNTLEWGREIERLTLRAAAMTFPRGSDGHAAQCAGRLRNELLQVGHDRRGAAWCGIELEQRELGIVRARDLAVAEHTRDLPNAAEPSREEPLHRVLGARVQVQSPRTVDATRRNRGVWSEARLEGPQMRLLSRDGDRDRRLHFEIAARIEAVAKSAQQVGAAFRHREVGGHATSLYLVACERSAPLHRRRPRKSLAASSTWTASSRTNPTRRSALPSRKLRRKLRKRSSRSRSLAIARSAKRWSGRASPPG